MQRILDVIVAAAIILVPALALTLAQAPASNFANATTGHYVAASHIQTNVASAPGGPGSM